MCDDFDDADDVKSRLRSRLGRASESLGQRQRPRKRKDAFRCAGQKQGRRGGKKE